MKTPRPAGRGVFRSTGTRTYGSLPSHLAQCGPDPLLGPSGPLFLAEALLLEALHRGQKPRCLRLAKNHGAGSFRERPGRAWIKGACLRGRPAERVCGITAGRPADC